MEKLNQPEMPEEEGKEKKWEIRDLTVKTKEVIKKLGKRNVAIALGVLVVGGAVGINILLFSGGARSKAGAEASVTDEGQDVYVPGRDTDVAEEPDVDGYFAATQVERKRSRDEAIEVLQMVVDNPESLEESRTAAAAEITQIAADIENESKIESLVAAKGFEKCIAVISDSKCSVIVKVENELLPNQAAQIYEIVYEAAGILPTNVKVIGKTDNTVPTAVTEAETN